MEGAFKAGISLSGKRDEIRKYPATPIQKIYWMEQLVSPRKSAANLPLTYHLSGHVDADGIQSCVDIIVKRNESLRTSFVYEEGTLYQVVSEQARCLLDFKCLLHMEVDNRLTAAMDILRCFSATPFDLSAAPLVRVILIRASEDTYYLGIVQHHSVSDIGSLALFVEDLGRIYSAEECRDGVASRPQYSRFSNWMESWSGSDECLATLDYWLNQASEHIAREIIPVDFSRPGVRGHPAVQIPLKLTPESMTSLVRLGRENGVELYVVLLTAYLYVLRKNARRDELLMGIPLTNRMSDEERATMGSFANVLPLKFSLGPMSDFSELLKHVRFQLLLAHRHQRVPLGMVLDKVYSGQNRDSCHLMQNLFTVFPACDLVIKGVEIKQEIIYERSPILDVAIYWVDACDGMHGILEYDPELFESSTMERLASDYLSLLRSLAEGEEASSWSPSMLKGDESSKAVIISNFTADPIVDPLRYWFGLCGGRASVVMAETDQIFQHLLDANNKLSLNKNGINIILFRFSDLFLFEDYHGRPPREITSQIQGELINALRSASRSSASPILVCVCPDHFEGKMAMALNETVHRAKVELKEEVEALPGLYFVDAMKMVDLYGLKNYFDAEADAIGKIPYTTSFFSCLAAYLMRRVHLISTPPYKVVVADCDNTLWKGVVGEDGVGGLIIDEPYAAFQSELVKLAEQGVVLCLCSRNNEADVWQVFEQHQGMVLKREHITSWRINWSRKSENIRAMAHDLNLGLDSFVFLDDDPFQCEEVKANLPQVLVLATPRSSEDIIIFLRHIWAFDRRELTAEDKFRSRFYKEESRRKRQMEEDSGYKNFIERLRLKVTLEPLTPDDIPRASQLTYRVNQFNTTSIRRGEAEMLGLLGDSDSHCLCVRVSDRFGDYGFVGLVEWKLEGRAVRIESFMLSCRSLGRGVEHHIINQLAALALDRQADVIEVVFRSSDRNMPVKQFLNEVAGRPELDREGGVVYSSTPAEMLSVQFAPSDAPVEKDVGERKNIGARAGEGNGLFATQPETRADVLEIIAAKLRSARDIENAVSSFLQREARKKAKYTESALEADSMVPPRTESEKILASIWKDVLCIEDVGVKNNFFDLGGSSIHLPQIISALSRKARHDFTIIDLLQYPTISALAARMDECIEARPIAAETLSRAEKQKMAMRNRVKKRRGRIE